MIWTAAKMTGALAGIGAAVAAASHFSLPPIERKLAPYLGVTADVRSAPEVERVYRPEWRGQSATYKGNLFGLSTPDHVLHLRSRAGSDGLLGVSETLRPGDRIALLDDAIYDLAAISGFVRISVERSSRSGYIALDTLFGETVADDATAIALRDGATIYEYKPSSREIATAAAGSLREPDYAKTFGLGDQIGVHPLSISGTAVLALQYAVRLDCDETVRAEIVSAAKAYVGRYLKSEGREIAGALAWPYPFVWDLKPGTKLTPPWYSGYANSIISLSAALLFHLTGDAEHRNLAMKAAAWTFLPLERGGARYEVAGFPHVAEYVYDDVPNLRVLDGELASAVALYNVAVILRDGPMLRQVARIIAGLSVELPHTAPSTGYAINSRFGWVVGEPDYMNLMKRWARQLYSISKDGAFKRAADNWRIRER